MRIGGVGLLSAEPKGGPPPGKAGSGTKESPHLAPGVGQRWAFSGIYICTFRDSRSGSTARNAA